MIANLIKISDKKLLLPFYHAVCDEKLDHLQNLYTVRDVKTFKQDIDFILKYYKPIDPLELVSNIENKKQTQSNSVLFTFDDGLKEIYNIIVPILKRKGIPAVFFLNTAFVDNKDLFYRYKASLIIERIKFKNVSNAELNEIATILSVGSKSEKKIYKYILEIDYSKKSLLDKIAGLLGLDFKEFLKESQPYLTQFQLKDIIDKGFTLGAHSIDHPEYFKIPLQEQLYQTTKSIEWIDSTFKQKHKFFAFPFTDHQVSNRFFDHINSLVDISFGCAGLKEEMNPKHLQRIPMEISNKSAKQIIITEYLKYVSKKIIGKSRIKRA